MKVKQVIVMRKDLKMRRGKEMAQAAHASMAALLSLAQRDTSSAGMNITLSTRNGTALYEWLSGKFRKIALYTNSEEELLKLYEKAKDKGLPVALITDCGDTEFNGVPTNTCIAIGPAEDEIINEITGGLKLA